MSTILRALQRVEGEKSDDGQPGGLREGLVSHGEPLVREGRRRWRIGTTGFLAAFLLGFFVWWLMPAGEVVEESVPMSPEIATAPEQAPTSARRPSARRSLEAARQRPAVASERPPLVRSTEPVAAPPPPVEAAAPRAPVADPPLAPAATLPEPAAQVVAAPPPPAPVETTAPREPVVERPSPPPVSAQASPAPAPKPAARPPAPREKTPPVARVAKLVPPKVTVKKTIWHPTPERRVAEIEVEGRKGVLELHEGDAVGTLVVAEIQPSGVVFLHGGEKLKRTIGSR